VITGNLISSKIQIYPILTNQFTAFLEQRGEASEEAGSSYRRFISSNAI